MIRKETIEDLYVRFICHLPMTEKSERNRIMHHVQLAYWFYLDNLCTPVKKSFNFSGFSRGGNNHNLSLFQFVLSLSPYLNWKKNEIKHIIKNFWDYNAEIPRCGGILLNESKTKVLLVKSYGGTRWNFPAGKINYAEEYSDCAEREVFEETGFHGVIKDTEKMICYKKKKALYYLYLFENIPENYEFTAQTKNEISEIKWFDINSLNQIVDIPYIREKMDPLLTDPEFYPKTRSSWSMQENLWAPENYILL
jgi:8-oxo-dGTP pyrophosphatase MutT (NUDIX family)